MPGLNLLFLPKHLLIVFIIVLYLLISNDYLILRFIRINCNVGNLYLLWHPVLFLVFIKVVLH